MWTLNALYFKLIDTALMQKIAVELKTANQKQITTHFKVTISNYLPADSTFFKVLKVFYTN